MKPAKLTLRRYLKYTKTIMEHIYRVLLGYIELVGISLIGVLVTAGVYSLVRNDTIFYIMLFIFALVAAKKALDTTLIKYSTLQVVVMIIYAGMYTYHFSISYIQQILLSYVSDPKNVEKILEALMKAWGLGFIITMASIAIAYILNFTVWSLMDRLINKLLKKISKKS